MTPHIHRIMVIRDNLDRIERALGTMDADDPVYHMLGGLLSSVQDRLDNVRAMVPDVKADA